MDVVKAVETYVTKMISTPHTVKVLLLDTQTVRQLAHLSAMVDVDQLSDTYCFFIYDPKHSLGTASLFDRQDR